MLQRELGIRVPQAAPVARVERLDANDDFEPMACAHGAVRKLIVLPQRDIGEAVLAGECGAVREAAEEDAEAGARGKRSEPGHQRHTRQLDRRDVGVACQDGLHLRAHASRLVEVVVVPVEQHLAPGHTSRLQAFLADGRAAWQDEQPHAQAPRRRVGPGAHLLDDRRQAFRRKHGQVWILQPQQLLDGNRAIVNHQGLERAPVVLHGDLTQREQRILGPIAGEHNDGGEGPFFRLQRDVRRGSCVVLRTWPPLHLQIHSVLHRTTMRVPPCRLGEVVAVAVIRQVPLVIRQIGLQVSLERRAAARSAEGEVDERRCLGHIAGRCIEPSLEQRRGVLARWHDAPRDAEDLRALPCAVQVDLLLAEVEAKPGCRQPRRAVGRHDGRRHQLHGRVALEGKVA